jgi:hypothetical protein
VRSYADETITVLLALYYEAKRARRKKRVRFALTRIRSIRAVQQRLERIGDAAFLLKFHVHERDPYRRESA